MKRSVIRSQLVVAILCDVPHPRQRLVTRLLDDFEVTDLDARNGEIRDFKFNLKVKSFRKNFGKVVEQF